MIKFTVVVRNVSSVYPDHFMDFEAPELPREGEYISIHRPDIPPPCTQDMVVKKVWWQLDHPTKGEEEDTQEVGTLKGIFVECAPAIGPYSSKEWLGMVDRARRLSVKVPEFEVRRSDKQES